MPEVVDAHPADLGAVAECVERPQDVAELERRPDACGEDQRVVDPDLGREALLQLSRPVRRSASTTTAGREVRVGSTSSSASPRAGTPSRSLLPRPDPQPRRRASVAVTASTPSVARAQPATACSSHTGAPAPLFERGDGLVQVDAVTAERGADLQQLGEQLPVGGQSRRQRSPCQRQPGGSVEAGRGQPGRLRGRADGRDLVVVQHLQAFLRPGNRCCRSRTKPRPPCPGPSTAPKPSEPVNLAGDPGSCSFVLVVITFLPRRGTGRSRHLW